jgi:hypothetical protein
MTRYPFPPTDETWPPELAPLVIAVRAPAQPGELAGEDAAAGSFRAVRDAAQPHSTRRTLARVLAVKVAAGAAVLVAGGYAVAAATGAVPGPPFLPSFAPDPALTTPGVGSPGPYATLDQRGPGLAPGADPTHRPAESYVGLCHAYFSNSAGHGTPPMRALMAAAGGVDRVTDFCAAAGVPSPTPPTAKPNPPKTTKPTPARPTPIKPEKSSGPPPDRTPRTPPGGGPESGSDSVRPRTA